MIKLFSFAHEDYPGNPAGEMAMDLHNNEVGRSIGNTARFEGVPIVGALPRLSNDVYLAWENGWLITSPE